MAASLQIDRDLCINSNYQKMHCELCKQNCPLQCIRENFTIDENQCNDCGICQSACPMEAIFSTVYTRKAVENALNDSKAITISCQRQDTSSPWPCLGFLNDRLLLVFAVGGRRVVIDDRSCAACKLGVEVHLQKIISKTNEFLLAKNMLEVMRGEILRENSKCSKSISRRDFFTQLLGATVDTVREVMGPTASIPERLPEMDLFRRYALQDYLSLDAIQQQIFCSIAIDHATCQACGLCVKICPQKAITTQEESGVLHFLHDPMVCNACGVCVGNCYRRAISLTNTVWLKLCEVAAVPLPRCNGCGQLFQPIGDQKICFECLLKGKLQVSE